MKSMTRRQQAVGRTVARLLTILALATAAPASAGEPASPPATPTPAEFLQRVIEIATHGDLWDPNFVARQLGGRFVWGAANDPKLGYIGVNFSPDKSGGWPPHLVATNWYYYVVKVPDSVKPRARLSFGIDPEKLCVQLSDVPEEVRKTGRPYFPTAPSRGGWGPRESDFYGWIYRFQGYNDVKLGLTFYYKKCLQEIHLTQNVD